MAHYGSLQLEEDMQLVNQDLWPSGPSCYAYWQGNYYVYGQDYESPPDNNSMNDQDNGLGVMNCLLPPSDTINIPIGSEYGDSLRLYEFAFLPQGWSFSISDSGWFQAPGTLVVEMSYPPEGMNVEDSAIIVIYAYDDQEEFAGNAQVEAFYICDCTDFCDMDGVSGITPVEVAYIVQYVYKSLDARPVLPDCPGINGDWDCSGTVTPLDVTWYVQYVYKSLGDGPCDPCSE